MNSRERVRLALGHKEADHVPFDLGSTPLTTMHESTYRNLRSHLGLTPGAGRVKWLHPAAHAVREGYRGAA